MTDIGRLVAGLRREDAHGQLLHAVIEARLDEPISIAELARRLGRTESKTLRQVNDLIEIGLITDERFGRQRIIRANRESPFYDTVAQLLFIQYGTIPKRDPVRPGFDAFFALQPTGLAELVPGELHPPRSLTGMQPPHPNDTYNGPTPAVARDQAVRISLSMSPYGELHDELQSAYSEWHEERDRDLIHQVLHLGGGAGTAYRALVSSAEAAQSGLVAEAGIGQSAWALATFCVQGEAILLRRFLDWCRTGVQLMYQRASETNQLNDRLRILNSLQKASERVRDDPSQLEHDSRAAIDRHRTNIAELEGALGRYYRVGGTPTLEKTGTAGERLICQRLAPVADALGQYANDMATHPSFDAWRPVLEQLQAGELLHTQGANPSF